MQKFRTWLDKQGRGSKLSLARKLGVSPAAISQIISGKNLPSLRLAAAIERESNGEVRAVDFLEDA